MAQVGGKVTYVVNATNGVKQCLITFTAMTTGDVITMSSGTIYQMSTIVAVTLGKALGDTSTFAGTAHVVASNVLSVNGTSGVQSGYAMIWGF